MSRRPRSFMIWWKYVARLVVLVGLGIVLAAPTPAMGRPGSQRMQSAEAQLALRLRSAGEQALSRRDFDAAARSFEKLYRQTLRAEGLYLLGLLAYTEGRLLAAQDLMGRFLDDPRLAPTSLELEQREARRILEEPRPESGRLNIIGTREVLISVDGRLTGALPLAHPLLLSPGVHALSLESHGTAQTEALDVRAGRLLEATYASESGALLFQELPGVLLREEYIGLGQDAAARLGQSLRDLLHGERLSVFSAAPGGSDEEAARKSQLAQALDARIARREPGPSWQVRLTLSDVAIGDEAARSEKECTSCSPLEIIELLRVGLADLFSAARSRARGTIVVSSEPPGAVVRSGDRVLGRTPLRRAAWAGRLELDIELPGYLRDHCTLEVSADKEAAAQVALQSVPIPRPPPVLPDEPRPPASSPMPPPIKRPVRPRWRLALGGALLGGGALVAGFGISALTVADHCTAAPQLPALMCRQLYGTSEVGSGLLVSGGLSLAAGALLLILPGTPAQAARLGEKSGSEIRY